MQQINYIQEGMFVEMMNEHLRRIKGKKEQMKELNFFMNKMPFIDSISFAHKKNVKIFIL